MAKRSHRDFEGSFEQHLKSMRSKYTNPFPAMMTAAPSAADKTEQGGTQLTTQHAGCKGTATAAGRRQHPQQGSQQVTVPCTHCGLGLAELQAQQCHRCKNIYCSSCSRINYDAHEDRLFCLDCDPEQVVTCCCHDDDDNITCDVFNYDTRDQSTTRCDSRFGYAHLVHTCSQAAVAAATAQEAFGHSNLYDNSSGGSSHSHWQQHSCSFPQNSRCSGHNQCPSTPGNVYGYSNYQQQQHSCPTATPTSVMASYGHTANCTAPRHGTSNSSSIHGSQSPDSLGSSEAFAWRFSSYSSTPRVLCGSAGSQLLATSPVIPFVCGADEGYVGLANKVMEAAVASC